jgi:hypothetical protein
MDVEGLDLTSNSPVQGAKPIKSKKRKVRELFKNDSRKRNATASGSSVTRATNLTSEDENASEVATSKLKGKSKQGGDFGEKRMKK